MKGWMSDTVFPAIRAFAASAGEASSSRGLAAAVNRASLTASAGKEELCSLDRLSGCAAERCECLVAARRGSETAVFAMVLREQVLQTRLLIAMAILMFYGCSDRNVLHSLALVAVSSPDLRSKL